jgi:hypothetical protein
VRVLICGSRTWTNPNAVYDELKRRPEVDVVIEGCAFGADRYAESAAFRLERKVQHFPADWDLYGKRAGFLRNRRMLTDGKPDEVWAFWDGTSRGTQHMIDLVRDAGVVLKVFRSADPDSGGTK